jgi:hypothetical protein
MADGSRRFPPPWRADRILGGYVVRDANRPLPTAGRSDGIMRQSIRWSFLRKTPMSSQRLCARAAAGALCLCAACIAIACLEAAESDCPGTLQVASASGAPEATVCRPALPTPADAPEKEPPVRLFSTITPAIATSVQPSTRYSAWTQFSVGSDDAVWGGAPRPIPMVMRNTST